MNIELRCCTPPSFGRASPIVPARRARRARALTPPDDGALAFTASRPGALQPRLERIRTLLCRSLSSFIWLELSLCLLRDLRANEPVRCSQPCSTALPQLLERDIKHRAHENPYRARGNHH